MRSELDSGTVVGGDHVTIHSEESGGLRSIRKSLSGSLPLVTMPSSVGCATPSLSASTQNRKPDCARFSAFVYTRTFRASGRGVSCHGGDHALSRPSLLIAEVA